MEISKETDKLHQIHLSVCVYVVAAFYHMKEAL